MILYPDIFPIGMQDKLDIIDTFANAKRAPNFDNGAICDDCTYSEVAASLPLARAMGAILTSELNLNVTHILCDISCISIKWHRFISQEIFADSLRGSALIKKLTEIDNSIPVDIILVSPRYVRDLF